MKYTIFMMLWGLVFFSSCSDENDSKPIVYNNNASIQYNDKTIVFEDISLIRTLASPDSESENGFILRGYKKTNNAKDDDYYVFMDFKKEENNTYTLRRLNFGITEDYFLKLYVAYLKPEFINTDVVFQNTTTGMNLKGSFSGNMLYNVDNSTLKITKGLFDIDLNSIR